MNETNTTATNATTMIDTNNATASIGRRQQVFKGDPYHSYFEFSYSAGNNKKDDREEVLRGVTANIFGQDSIEVEQLQTRKQSKKVKKKKLVVDEVKNEGDNTNSNTNNITTTTTNTTSTLADNTTDSNNSYNSSSSSNSTTTTTIGVDGNQDVDSSNTKNTNDTENVFVFAKNNTKLIDTSRRRLQEKEFFISEVMKKTNIQSITAATTATTSRSSSSSSSSNHRRLQQVVDEENQQQQQVNSDRTKNDKTNEYGLKKKAEEEDDKENIKMTDYNGDDELDDDVVIQRKQMEEFEAMDDMQIPELQHRHIHGDDQIPPDEEKAVDEANGREQVMQLKEEVAAGADDGEEDVLIEAEKRNYDDDYGGRRGGDDYYMRDRMGDDYNAGHNDYYSTKNYIRITPHILTDPIFVEVPKLYGNVLDKEEIILVPVSYYLDEDEYEGLFSYNRYAENDDIGDETEVRRGTYVANAIMAYSLGDHPRWMGQTHLDLSSDYTAPPNATLLGPLTERPDASYMGAFALSTPTVADIDGDSNPDVIIGTGMGIVYVFDARQLFKRTNWPIQMPYPIESRILVEDVLGDTSLEIFIADIGSNIVCFNHKAEVIWNRNLLASMGKADTKLSASSPMTLGDIDGDGSMDLVVLIRVDGSSFLFALDAVTGDDKRLFPIELFDGKPSIPAGMEELHQKLPQPLLVDLHTDQSFLLDYIRRNGTVWKPPKKTQASQAPYGGFGSGLHIVQPNGQELYIIEGSTACTQKVSIGDEVSAMIQVEDVHGTDLLDLVIATESGNIATLETQAPYHPLNTWSHGEVRGRANTHAHGYSASQGIFVHDVSRQFVDIFGVYVPITFEIFDNRPGISADPSKRIYKVEIRDGPSWKRSIWSNQYAEPGVYSDRFYVKYGPGYYTFHIVLMTSHGIMYEDSFSVGYNVNYMSGFGILLWLPLLIASAAILLFGTKKTSWDDDDYDSDRQGRGLGILGRALQ